jgi:hypothetical protein
LAARATEPFYKVVTVPWADKCFNTSERIGPRVLLTGEEMSEEPKVGETWHVQFQTSSAISTVIITDLTAKTVEYRSFGTSYETRRLRGDVEFIEKANA